MEELAGQAAILRDIARPKRRRQIERWLVRLGVREQDIGDLAQESIAEIVCAAHRYEPSKSAERWINRIVLYTAANYLQLARWRREELVGELPDAATETTPETLLDRAQRMRLIADAAASLPEGLRQFLPVDLGGGAMVNHAAAHGIPLSTAYRARARGLAALGDAVRASVARRKR